MFNLLQLLQRIDRGQSVSVEEYLQAFFFENQNKDVGICTICYARGGFRGEQHAPVCRRASIMTLPDWVAVYRQREQEPKVGDA